MLAPKRKENKDLHQTNTVIESFQNISRGLSVFSLFSDQKRQRRICTATGESLIRRLKTMVQRKAWFSLLLTDCLKPVFPLDQFHLCDHLI